MPDFAEVTGKIERKTPLDFTSSGYLTVFDNQFIVNRPAPRRIPGYPTGFVLLINRIDGSVQRDPVANHPDRNVFPINGLVAGQRVLNGRFLNRILSVWGHTDVVGHPF